MKGFKMKTYLVLTLLLGVFLLSGCGGGSGSVDQSAGAADTNDAGATLTAIAVTPAAQSIPIGVTKQFTATGTYSDGTASDITALVTWDSATPDQATVNTNTGLATGLAAGSSVITATSGTHSGLTTLTITSATLDSIVVTPANDSIPVDLTRQFAATATYSDGFVEDITAAVTWKSADTLIATLNTSGLATGISAGSSVITATAGTQSAETTLTVTAATLSSIAITPIDPTVANGLNQKFTATGTYSDNSRLNITAAVTWASADTLIATLNNNGLATGIAAGSSLITATLGSTSADSLLTVNAALINNPLAPTLGEVDSFVILASQKITTTSGSAIVGGDLGILDQARSYYEGFTDGATAGQFTELTEGLSYAGDDATPPYVIPVPYASTVAFINQSRTDLGIAYNFLAADPNPSVATQVCPIELGGLTLTRGVYKTALDVTIQTGVLTLDGEGDPDSVFIFTIDGNLLTAATAATVDFPAGDIVLINNAQAKNIFWRTAGTTILGTNTSFSGNVFSWTQVNVLTGTSVDGRLFAVTEQVTLDANEVTKAQ